MWWTRQKWEAVKDRYMGTLGNIMKQSTSADDTSDTHRESRFVRNRGLITNAALAGDQLLLNNLSSSHDH